MIRRAADGDSEAIADLEGRIAPGAWSADSVRRHLALPTTRAWVVGEHDGHVIASAAGGVGEIITIAVRPEARRRGLARRLLDAARAQWRAEHVEEAFLEVRRDNDAARGLYESAGWIVVGERKRYYRDGTDAVLMRLERP